jgi:hypothetical protein
VRFPLGLGSGPSPAQTPTLGSALLDLAPQARTEITIGLVIAIVAATVALIAVDPPRTASAACFRAAAAYTTAIALAPAGRFGYLVYPISFLVWAIAFARGERLPQLPPGRGAASAGVTGWATASS